MVSIWSGLVVNALVVMLCIPLTFLLNCYRIWACCIMLAGRKVKLFAW